ncbi:hypothetical protein [Spirillospora sp. NPDC029432]|uniref:hypothetical protein n=1 Tax=Spirillospora sp. NPDC029432 TaxID=3154599 RepID=UPI0034558990
MPARDTTRTAAILRNRHNTGGYTVTGLAERIREVAPEQIRRELPSRRDLERTIRGHEAGEHSVGPRYRLLYALAYGTTEDELFAPSESEQSGRGSHQGTDTPHDWDEMERRRLLLAALGLGAGTFASSGEAVRQLLDLAVDSESRSIDDWVMTCVDQLHGLRTRPPLQVRESLSVELLALHRQLKTTRDKDVPELHRIAAALSTLHANVLTRLGEHGPALQWWRTAKAAADASGYLDVRMMVRTEEAGFGLYGQRDLRTVFRLVNAAERLAGDRPSFWKADLSGTRAKALSLLGRHDEAQRALHLFVHYDGTDGRASVFPTLWTFDQPHFAESWVYGGAGKEAEAGRAREIVLSHNRPGEYLYMTNVKLHAARCTIVNGGIDEGARMAAGILDALPIPYRSQLITETGKAVLGTIPGEKRTRPAVREFAELLVKTAPAPNALPTA